jgi:hypothetical protein
MFSYGKGTPIAGLRPLVREESRGILPVRVVSFVERFSMFLERESRSSPFVSGLARLWL